LNDFSPPISKPECKTFGEVLAEYNSIKRRNLKPNTAQSYAEQTRRYVDPSIGYVPMSDITTQMLQRFFNDLEDKGLANGSLLKVKNIISPVFRYALNQLRIINHNPFDSDFIKLGGVTSVSHKPFSPEKMKEIMDGTMKLPTELRRMIALMGITGMRTGEMLGLRWEDIDLSRTNREIHIQRQASHPDKNLPVIGTPKTKTSIRCVPMTPALEEALSPMEKSGFVVGGDVPLTNRQLALRQKAFMKTFHIEKGYTLYSLRCTRLTELVENNLPIDLVAQLAGHADTKTTRKYYIHIRDKGMSNLAQAMSDSWRA
jgi:integrase